MSRSILALAAAALFFAGAFNLRRGAWVASSRRADDDLDVPRLPATTARALSFGFESVAADVFYLEAVQVHGMSTSRVPEAELERRDAAEARLLEYAVDLDPLFAGAYRFAGMALPRETPSGRVYGVLDARNLLARGTTMRPDDWRIPFFLGFLESYYLDDTAAAGQALRLAAARPAAPKYVGLLASRLAADAGRFRDAEAMARAMIGETADPALQQEWRTRLEEIEDEERAQSIEAAARRFREERGRLPADIEELVAAGLLPSAIRDSHGGRFVFDPATGAAQPATGRRLRIHKVPGKQSGLEVR